MSIRVAIRHKTTYEYDRAVALSPHLVRLRPAAHCRTPILGYSLKVLPEKHFVNWQQDPFGNFVARYVFPEKIRQLTIDVAQENTRQAAIQCNAVFSQAMRIVDHKPQREIIAAAPGQLIIIPGGKFQLRAEYECPVFPWPAKGAINADVTKTARGIEHCKGGTCSREI